METICSGGAPFGQWALYTFIFLLISLAIHVFLYLIQKIYNNPKAAANLAQDIIQVIYTVFLFLFLISFYKGMCGFDMGDIFNHLPGGDGADGTMTYEEYYCGTKDCKTMFDFSLAYLTKLSGWTGNTIILTTITYSAMGSLASTTMDLKTHKVNPFRGLKVIADTFLSLVANGLVIILLSAATQMVILYYAWSPMVGVFLPFGFLLRSFAPTRNVGGAIIGAVLTMTIFYPLLLMINGLVVKVITPEDFLVWPSRLGAAHILGWAVLGAKSIGTRTLGNPMVSDWVQRLGGQELLSKLARALKFGDKTITRKIFGIEVTSTYLNMLLFLIVLLTSVSFIFSAFSVVGTLSIGGVLLPTITILLLSNISTALSTMLGERLDVSNLTRMI